MPRCCAPIDGEYVSSYASVAFLGAKSVRQAVEELEEQPLTPCFTAWCAECHRGYLLTRTVGKFKRPSEHHVHQLALADRLRSLMGLPAKPAVSQ